MGGQTSPENGDPTVATVIAPGWDVGGDAPLDLICLTPDEFESAKRRITLVAEVLPEAIDLLAEEPAPA